MWASYHIIQFLFSLLWTMQDRKHWGRPNAYTHTRTYSHIKSSFGLFDIQKLASTIHRTFGYLWFHFVTKSEWVSNRKKKKRNADVYCDETECMSNANEYEFFLSRIRAQKKHVSYSYLFHRQQQYGHVNNTWNMIVVRNILVPNIYPYIFTRTHACTNKTYTQHVNIYICEEAFFRQ